MPDNHLLPTVAVALPEPARAPAGWRGVLPSDFNTALRMAKVIVASGMAPRSYFTGTADPTAAVFTAMQLGAEVGLSPMSAVQNVAVINGRPGMYGPAMLAVVEASGKLSEIEEVVSGEGDARAAVCTVTRAGRKPRTFRFSVADAKRARLWGKSGPWTDYPDRMLLARARTFALRDVFPDVLLGLSASVEELQDIPAAHFTDAAPCAPEMPAPAPQKPEERPAPEKPAQTPDEFWAAFWMRDTLTLADKPDTTVDQLMTRLRRAVPRAPSPAMLDALFAHQPQALLAGAMKSDRWTEVEAARRARFAALMEETEEEAPEDGHVAEHGDEELAVHSPRGTSRDPLQ